MWSNLRSVGRALRAVSLTIFCTLQSVPPVAAAADPQHPLVPSHRDVRNGTLYESGVPPAPFAPSPVAVTAEALDREGGELYGTHCATCHGGDLRGARGAPSLIGKGGAATDFYISTGRMPLAVRAQSAAAGESADRIMASGTQAFHGAPHFDDRQTQALVEYVTRRGGPSIRVPDVRLDSALLAHGRLLYESNCEACHGAAAQGATAGYQWTALPLDLASPRQIGEAIRIGPGVMPRFTSAQLSEDDVASVATYVRMLATTPQNYGGVSMGFLGPSAEGAVGAFFGVGLLFWVIYFTGTKSDGRRMNERDPRA